MTKILILITIILLTTVNMADAKTNKIKVSGCGFSSGKVYLKTNIKGHKMTIRTPQIIKW